MIDPHETSATPPAQAGVSARAGRFVTGSIMRHVAVMTLTGSVGLTFMFLADFVILLYVSRLGDEGLTSAVGYAWTVQFFTVSLGIGFGVATTALVSRELGADNRKGARRIAGSAMGLMAMFQAVVAVVLLILRRDVLELLGAEGESLDAAARFLLITLPTLPLMALGMLGSSVLRAAGDARRAMQVTLSAGIAVAATSPFLIFDDVQGLPGLGLGIDGAAMGLGMNRCVTASLGYRYAVRVHDLVQRPRWRTLRLDLGRVARIAAPASLTQLSTPFANFLLTAAISAHGASAVAGWAVVSRMTVLAFAGVIALSAAISGIVGQNFGAHRYDRVRMTYRDAVIFSTGYVLVIWAVLSMTSGWIAWGFSLSNEGAEVVVAFGQVGAGAFLFASCAFVATAAFNSLGRPLWSTAVNWGRDAGAMPLMLALIAGAGGAATQVVYAQAAALTVAGIAAGWAGWIYVRRLERRRPETR